MNSEITEIYPILVSHIFHMHEYTYMSSAMKGKRLSLHS